MGRKPTIPPDTVSGVWNSQWGRFAWTCTDAGVCRLQFPEPGRRETPLPAGETQHGHIRQLIAWLEAWLGGNPAPPEMPPLDLSAGTDFQRLVWRAMCAIPFGQTRSYGELAGAIGRAGAVRAVGGACGANPLPLLVPCHRVVAANGRIGGFSASGGVAIKQRLLTWEQRAASGPAPTTVFDLPSSADRAVSSAG